MATRNETPGQDEHRGLGFHLAGTPDCFFSTAVPADCFGHTGFTGTSLLVEPGTGFWVLLLSNRVYPTRNSSALFPFRRKLHADSWRLFQEFSGTTGFPAPSAKVLPEEDRIWFDEYTEGGAYPEAAERTGSWLYRLLNLPDEVQEGVVSGRITERHARALLSVPQGQIRSTYRHIVQAGLNVRRTEEYIAALNRGEVKPKPKKRKQKTKGFTRNMQIAVNSVNQCVDMITKMGIRATVETDDQDNELRMIIHLPK